MYNFEGGEMDEFANRRRYPLMVLAIVFLTVAFALMIYLLFSGD